MLEITESIEIYAPCNLTWDTLTDLGAYHRWSSFLSPRGGSLREGETISMQMRPPFEPSFTASPTVAEVREGQSIVLSGPGFMQGSLSAQLHMELTPTSMESVRITQRMRINGFMVQYHMNSLLRTWRFGLNIMNSELKLRAETLYDEALMGSSYDTIATTSRPTFRGFTPLPVAH